MINYVLSKVWFRCGSVDIREGDISAINSAVKSWMYADLLEKPSEAVMCRPPSYGGLGVNSVKDKAKALLTRTFLETDVNPNFRHSLLHSIMFGSMPLETLQYPTMVICLTTHHLSLKLLRGCMLILLMMSQ